MVDPKAQSAKDSLWSRIATEWTRWTGASVNRGIFGAAVTIAVLTVLAKVVAVAKELAIAGTFGTGDVVDAFLIAFLLPTFAINVVAGSFNAALIPTFVKVKEQEGHEAAQRLLSSIVFWSLALLSGVVIVLGLSASFLLPLIASGFGPAKLALTRTLFFILLPILIASGLATTWSAVLNAGQKFALAALTPAIAPAITLTAVLTLGPTWGIYTVVSGVVLGAVVEASVLGIGLKRSGFSLRPKWRGSDDHTKEVLGQYAPMVAGAFLMSGTSVVDQSMAAILGPGSVAALAYGNRIVGFVLGILSLALGTAVLPFFSRMVAARDWASLHHTLRTYGRLILTGTVPLVIVLVVCSKPLVRLLYERGSFTAADTLVVSQVQTFYTLQIPFYALGLLVVRLISSLRANQILMWGAVLSLLLDIVLNYIFIHLVGVAGIGLSTTLVYAASLFYLVMMLRRLMHRATGSNG